jgi:hypothetical protein
MWMARWDSEGNFQALEGPDEVPVIRSSAGAGTPSWLDRHPAFDEFLPEPEAVLRRVAAARELLADLQAERHLVVEGDCWYTCPAATVERDGGDCCDDDRRGGPCACGRDARVERRVRLLAESWGWTEGAS